jgi:CRP-like cAMP-binding protein
LIRASLPITEESGAGIYLSRLTRTRLDFNELAAQLLSAGWVEVPLCVQKTPSIAERFQAAKKHIPRTCGTNQAGSLTRSKSMSDEHCMKFGPAAFLASVGLGRRVVEFQAEECFFTQGDPADSIFVLQRGRAKLAVVSEKGKQATISLLFPGDLFGEEALAAKPVPRPTTSLAVYACTALKITREEMNRALHEHRAFSGWFVSYVVARGIRTQADLADHMFNCSEKRLARTLLMMAEFGKPDELQTTIPPITQETLAEMIGTTRSRVSYFMNRFRDLGVIDYKDRIQVNKSKLKAILVGEPTEYEAPVRAAA